MEIGGESPPQAKNLLIPAHLEKFPPSRLPHPDQIFILSPPVSSNFQVITQ